MHIEAGVVEGGKMLLSYATGTAVLLAAIKLAWDHINKSGLLSLLLKTVISITLVFTFFEIFPHHPIGISEVHLILGTTLLLLFGLAPAMLGLAFGLLLQGITVAHFDLPQYGINVTTLLASMLMLHIATKKIIPQKMAYKDITYTQMFKMSVVWEGAIISWVAFWAFYGQGFTIENIQNVSTFASAYLLVIILEPLIDLVILSIIKAYYKQDTCSILFNKRLTNCQA